MPRLSSAVAAWHHSGPTPETTPEFPMFERLLIANRGEIACRIARTARRMGLTTVAVFSDVDAAARHVRQCDHAVHLGSERPAESYLAIDKIVTAARQTGAQAVHPGYGFLAENPELAEACAAAGLIFVGPPADAMRAMAAKDAARRRMAAAGVPVTPGYDGEDQSEQAFLSAAREIGFPLLVKASAGGGGRGMRLVEKAEALPAALAAARAEAESAFGDGKLLLERYLVDARHVEVQVIADAHGNIVHLFDRDCSIQRRRQKLLEEAPAPEVPDDVRTAMAEAAVTCAREIGYVNAGTIEFLLTPDGRFSFMEMNTRLQVEHPVTEAITGIDLVEWQLRVTAGEPLPLRQDQIGITGHAIEARIIAEDPAHDFAPESGSIACADWPDHPGIRVDTGYDTGDLVPAAYDSLIAKMVAHGNDRAEALRRLTGALREAAVGPRPTTIGLLARIAVHEDVTQGAVRTNWLEATLPALKAVDPQPIEDALALAVWKTLAPGIGHGDPWSRRDGWRLSGHGASHLTWTTPEGAEHIATVTYRGDTLHCALGSGDVVLTEGELQGPRATVRVNGHRISGVVLRDGDALVVLSDGQRVVFAPPARSGTAHGVSGDGRIAAPLPGKVLAVMVAPGQPVAAGAPLVTLEAMKIQHSLEADRDGIVEAVNCAPGQQVARDDMLVVIGPPPD